MEVESTKLKLIDVVKENAERRKNIIHSLLFDRSKNKKFIIVYRVDDNNINVYDLDTNINIILSQGVPIDNAVSNTIIYHNDCYTKYECKSGNKKWKDFIFNKFGLSEKDSDMKIRIIDPETVKTKYLLLGWKLHDI